MRAPGPSLLELVGPLRRRLLGGEDRLGAILELHERFGPLVRLGIGKQDFYFVNEADAARHILVDNHHNYVKSRRYDVLRPVLGNGLITSDGELWRRQRKLVAPAFHGEHITSLAAMMVEIIEETLARWGALPGRVIDLPRELARMTLLIAARSFFGADLGARTETFADAMTVLFEDAERRISHLFTPPSWVPTPANRRAREALAELDGIVAELVRSRRGGGSKRDILSLLLGGRDERGEGMTDRQVRDEVMTILIAGHETTAGALNWTFYDLARHPDLARPVEEEVDVVLEGGPARFEHLARLPRLTAFLQESMRLHPSVWVVQRRALAADALCGYPIPADSTVILVIYALHRNRRHWADPERFDPGRFAPGAGAGRHRFAYLPFVAGPRGCVGEQMALQVAHLTLATVLRRHRLPLAPGHDLLPDPKLTLRPKPGLWVTLQPRAAA
jgi:cytochrome P450